MSPECPLPQCSERFESNRARAQHIRRDHDVDRPAANKEVLHRLYVVDDLTQAEIADRYDVTQGTIGNWLEKYDITKATRISTGGT